MPFARLEHPPIILYGQDEYNDPYSWYWEQHAGGMLIPFGKYKGQKIHDVPLSYLEFCQRKFEDKQWVRPFLNAVDHYIAGLEAIVEDEYEKFIVPFGNLYNGKTIEQCRDKKWMLWTLTQPYLCKRYPLYFEALKEWINHPRKQEAFRDIGESLSQNEYDEDMGNQRDSSEEDDSDLQDFIVPDNDDNEGDDESDYHGAQSSAEAQDKEPNSPRRHSAPPEQAVSPITRSQTRRKRQLELEIERLNKIKCESEESRPPLKRTKKCNNFQVLSENEQSDDHSVPPPSSPVSLSPGATEVNDLGRNYRVGFGPSSGSDANDDVPLNDMMKRNEGLTRSQSSAISSRSSSKKSSSDETPERLSKRKKSRTNSDSVSKRRTIKTSESSDESEVQPTPSKRTTKRITRRKVDSDASSEPRSNMDSAQSSSDEIRPQKRRKSRTSRAVKTESDSNG